MNSATRNAYGEGLKQLVSNPNVVVLEADLGAATKSEEFAKVCPQRYFNMGIAEADMVGTAAGLAAAGKTPFASSFAVFIAGRAFEQIRNSVCYPNLNVKLVGSHAGISVGPDGGSHQSIEDIALMRSLPNMTVLCPADDVEAKAAVLAAADHYGPVYIRTGRMPVATFHEENKTFTIGKGEILKEGTDLSIIACGLMVQEALKAADQLEQEGISTRVVNMATIKPLDTELVLDCAQKTGRIVTAEEATVYGGLGSAVAEVVAQACPVPVFRVGVKDKFGKSGEAHVLLEEYGLSAKAIVDHAKAMLEAWPTDHTK